ncbi:alkaline phosphatase family protein [Cuniculiplasma divulgatum]|jgi:predicted AlkP superfamily pyrophosphatase or phosphodiesterase|uniref:Type I phosphodiesterase/nucleotide pyrophosphatase n=1 Tax=Cuniculiplasma divulgatum TaxID=1673428 RepID=A0A1N5VXL5_9ARCH|nr:alkaline phosphatase family protein [Cuniculiplasma divulgatum]WMT49671.1 MAG: alkaline phosphatase family protein [Thermoplasmatales archaeon]SIM77310.1 type I phosphodiesterase/nucleotide pyrophosphatase [Cuniculiplasma divulgatum]
MESNDLVLPNYENGSLYNLAQSVMTSLELRPHNNCLKVLPVDGKKMSVVLIDGFGYLAGVKAGIIEDGEPYLTSVFPSITTTALVTLMSGQLPGDHCVLGGTTFVKKFGTIIDNFQFSPVYSKGKDSLKEFGSMKDTYKVENTVEKAVMIGKKIAIISPEFIRKSELTTITNSTKGDHFHYYHLWDALYFYRKALENGYDFVYLYIPFADKLSHIYGPYSEQNLSALREIVNSVKKEMDPYKNEYRFIITADHGHVEAKRAIQMTDYPAVPANFSMAPFGSTRSIFFSGSSNLLESLNNYLPGLKIYDNNKNNLKMLLGSSECSRFSSFDYIGIPINGDSFFYPGSLDEGNTTYFKGRHGGLCRDEMLIPLIII